MDSLLRNGDPDHDPTLFADITEAPATQYDDHVAFLVKPEVKFP